MEAPPVTLLGPLRFQCQLCGACCQGVKAELEPHEHERIRGFASEMGVAAPLVGDALRLEGGKCVFLDPHGRCGLHGRYGPTAKPLVCQQFPFVLVDTESGMRAGVDPTSFHTLSTWHTAPPFDDAIGKARKSHFDPPNVHVEKALLAWCDEPGATVASVLGHLCGDRSGAPGLPPGFASRLVRRLQRMRLDVLLRARDAGPAQIAALTPLNDLIPTLDPDAPPPWPVLAPNEDAFAVEVCRRMVFLRLATRIPIVQGVALINLAGAVALAWATPDPERYGPALAAWNRVIRAGSFWQSLTPSPGDMQWLARG